jgi:hypothetical protein
MGQLSVRIDDELEELIEKEQDKYPYEIDKSKIVRTALREHLSGNVTAAKTIPAN